MSERPIAIEVDPAYYGYYCNGCNSLAPAVSIRLASVVVTLCPRCLDRLHTVIEAAIQRPVSVSDRMGVQNQ